MKIVYDLTFACVHTGGPFNRVVKLRDAIWRFARQPYDVVCLTDQPERCEGVNFIDISGSGLTGGWGRMMLFEPQWRGRSKIIFLDLNTTVVGALLPLWNVPGEFAICENDPGMTGTPGKYNSSVMVIGGGMASFVWSKFSTHQDALMQKHGGSDQCIEALYPSATLLQSLVPRGFFSGYRDEFGPALFVGAGGPRKD